MKNFVVIGNPVEHSQSPAIHLAFARQWGLALTYRKQLAPIGQFDRVAHQFFERGNGANVTVPFKEDALKFAQKLTERARLAGAVNTLSRQGGVIVGDNTDGVGLVSDIRDNHHCSFYDKKVLIIGAGGAARGVILPILHEKPASITIANRTDAKAQQLARYFHSYAPLLTCPLGGLAPSFDMIINATSASLSGGGLSVPPQIFAKNVFVYDMMYGAQPSPFLQMAAQRGAQTADGLGMLVTQAAKSFEVWHGLKPETQTVISDIRARLLVTKPAN